MSVSKESLKEVLTAINDDSSSGKLFSLIKENNEYAFALYECINSGYITGITGALNANGVPVFQKTSYVKLSPSGLYFLENS